jgi:hypothetical protein
VPDEVVAAMNHPEEPRAAEPTGPARS